MIQRFRDRWLRTFYLEDKTSKKIPSEVQDRLFRKLQLIDDATCDLDLPSPPSNHFEKLRGNLAGKHSIRVNKQWRLVFTWSGERGEAQEIYLDNHDYRHQQNVQKSALDFDDSVPFGRVGMLFMPTRKPVCGFGGHKKHAHPTIFNAGMSNFRRTWRIQWAGSLIPLACC